jgi:hypothetical protein
MTEYAVLIPGNESTWANATDEQKAAMYARHREFAEMLGERGHRITGGAELTAAATGKIVRAASGLVSVTDGPYAETAEQLTGLYLVETEDLDDLLQVVGHLAGAEGVLEVRECVSRSGSGG